MEKLIIAILVIFLAGCATAGKPMQQTQVDRIQKGKTTKQEIIQTFDQPDGTYFDKNGNLIWYYTAAKIKSTAWTFIPVVNLVHNEIRMKNQILTIVFNRDGIVEDYSFTDSDKSLKSGIIP